MTKNGEMIHVFDANGNEIGQTYPRRVQGLIKKGRARFTDDSETAIVLTDDKNENTEACPPVTDIHKSEDIKMFENTVEMNNTAEVLEAVEAIEPIEETVIDDTPENMPEELKRLYDKLDEIDGEISALNGFISVKERSGEMEEACAMTREETHRFEAQLDNLGNIREDTIQMIEAYKKAQASKENPRERYVREQFDFVNNQLKGAMNVLTERFMDGDIDADEYRDRFETLAELADNRVAILSAMLK